MWNRIGEAEMRSSKVLSIFSVLSLVVSLVGIVLFFAGIRWAVAICAAVSLLNSVLQVFCGDQNNFITEIITLVFGGLIGALTNIGLLDGMAIAICAVEVVAFVIGLVMIGRNGGHGRGTSSMVSSLTKWLAPLVIKTYERNLPSFQEAVQKILSNDYAEEEQKRQLGLARNKYYSTVFDDVGTQINHLADSRRKMEFLFNTSACGYDINIDNLAAGSVFAYAYWVISGKVALPGECLYVNDYVHELMLKATYKTFDDKSGEELVGKASDWEATTGDIQNGNDPEAR